MSSLTSQETGGHKKSEKKSDSKKKDKGESVKPSAAMNGTDSPKPTASPEQVEKLKSEITVQGDKVRNLKSGGAPKVQADIFNLHQIFHCLAEN